MTHESRCDYLFLTYEYHKSFRHPFAQRKENEKIRMRSKTQKLSLQQQIEPCSYLNYKFLSEGAFYMVSYVV